jgi:hypothetical protein
MANSNREDPACAHITDAMKAIIMITNINTNPRPLTKARISYPGYQHP